MINKNKLIMARNKCKQCIGKRNAIYLNLKYNI